MVRLHIYIINYITLLIIIFTPSRSLTHTQHHTNSDAENARQHTVPCTRARLNGKERKRKEMGKRRQPSGDLFLGHVDIPRDSDEPRQTVYTHETNTPVVESFSHDCHVRDLRFLRKKKRKDLFLLLRFCFFFFLFRRFIYLFFIYLFFFSFYLYVFSLSLFFLFGNSQNSSIVILSLPSCFTLVKHPPYNIF